MLSLGLWVLYLVLVSKEGAEVIHAFGDLANVDIDLGDILPGQSSAASKQSKAQIAALTDVLLSFVLFAHLPQCSYFFCLDWAQELARSKKVLSQMVRARWVRNKAHHYFFLGEALMKYQNFRKRSRAPSGSGKPRHQVWFCSRSRRGLKQSIRRTKW